MKIPDYIALIRVYFDLSDKSYIASLVITDLNKEKDYIEKIAWFKCKEYKDLIIDGKIFCYDKFVELIKKLPKDKTIQLLASKEIDEIDTIDNTLKDNVFICKFTAISRKDYLNYIMHDAINEYKKEGNL